MEDSVCVICQENPVEVRFPCGHAFSCTRCSKMLLERSQPCPTCRCPFKQFYIAPSCAAAKNLPAFISPANPCDSENFGKLYSPPLKERLHYKCCNCCFCVRKLIVCSLCLIGMLLFLICFLFPLASGLSECVIGFLSFGKNCDQPLARYLVLLAPLEFIGWVGHLLIWRRRRELLTSGGQKVFFARLIFHLSHFACLILGVVLLSRTQECDETLYNATFYMVFTILIVKTFFVVLLSCFLCKKFQVMQIIKRKLTRFRMLQPENQQEIVQSQTDQTEPRQNPQPTSGELTV
eukprot:c17983_g1_i1.p1 GENE.c17983_g1_i1~~c17983_g1_i1.p1  ORF type:complete len:292 (+),score=86.11 c17983_g1_i1:88-963(+)